MMAIMGKSTLQQRVVSMQLGPSLPGMAQYHFRSLLKDRGETL